MYSQQAFASRCICSRLAFESGQKALSSVRCQFSRFERSTGGFTFAYRCSSLVKSKSHEARNSLSDIESDSDSKRSTQLCCDCLSQELCFSGDSEDDLDDRTPSALFEWDYVPTLSILTSEAQRLVYDSLSCLSKLSDLGSYMGSRRLFFITGES